MSCYLSSALSVTPENTTDANGRRRPTIKHLLAHLLLMVNLITGNSTSSLIFKKPSTHTWTTLMKHSWKVFHPGTLLSYTYLIGSHTSPLALPLIKSPPHFQAFIHSHFPVKDESPVPDRDNKTAMPSQQLAYHSWLGTSQLLFQVIDLSAGGCHVDTLAPCKNSTRTTCYVSSQQYNTTSGWQRIRS